MRIALDATAIPPKRAGAGIYIFNLVQALAALDDQNAYVVFARPEHIGEFGIQQRNWQFIGVKHASTSRRLAWEQTDLPGQLRRLRIDVLHSPHYTMPVRMPCRAVVTFHDMTFFLMPELHGRGRRLFFRAMMRWSAKRADRLMADSESTRQDVMRVLRVPGDKIKTVPLAASSAFRLLPPESVQEACACYALKPGRYIYYVGVLEPRKNLPLLLRAYARLAEEMPDVPLVIAGKRGWLYAEVFRTVEELGLQERVRFLGHVPEEDLIALYNGARVFVYPSRYEGFGLPVLEAMQCGTPVITTNVSSMPEVAGETAALLIPPDDLEGLVDGLRRLVRDDELARSLAERGLARAQQFSWRRCAEETRRVYQSACP